MELPVVHTSVGATQNTEGGKCPPQSLRSPKDHVRPDNGQMPKENDWAPGR